MEALEALKERRSIRKFTQKPIDRKEIEKIIDAARFAPTALNIQPWEFIVVTDKDKKKEIADITDHGKFIAQAEVCIAIFCRDTKYYLEDGSSTTTYILVAACALGLGSCWVAGDKKPYTQDIANLLGVPEGFRLVSLVALGRPLQTPCLQKRGLKEILHWEKF
jgi:nitroreductase